MVVYGFLTYENGKVSIPNKELMDRFGEMLQKESSMDYVYQLAKHSRKMLEATIHGDTKTMEKILEYAHNTEVPILSYNHEVELAAIAQINDKKYELRLKGKLGEKGLGKILKVGISYNKKTKSHQCKVEV